MTALASDPFFWAFVSAIAATGGNAIQGSPVVGRSAAFGFCVVVTATLGRLILVLPDVVQPRFAPLGPVWFALGGSIVALAIGLLIPLRRIRPLTRPDSTERLLTGGLYGVIRHPGYLANVLLGLGAAVAFCSTIGIVLTPIWFAVFWLHALIEEEVLVAKYGAAYVGYMERVPSRLIPGLPF